MKLKYYHTNFLEYFITKIFFYVAFYVATLLGNYSVPRSETKLTFVWQKPIILERSSTSYLASRGFSLSWLLAVTQSFALLLCRVIRNLTKLRRRRQGECQKKTIGLMSKTTTLHLHHAFLYISLPSLHNYDVK